MTPNPYKDKFHTFFFFCICVFWSILTNTITTFQVNWEIWRGLKICIKKLSYKLVYERTFGILSFAIYNWKFFLFLCKKIISRFKAFMLSNNTGNLLFIMDKQMINANWPFTHKHSSEKWTANNKWKISYFKCFLKNKFFLNCYLYDTQFV